VRSLVAGLALSTAPALAQRAKVSEIIAYGTDPCPRSTDDDVVVCARRPQAERFPFLKSCARMARFRSASRGPSRSAIDRDRQLLGGRARWRDGLCPSGIRRAFRDHREEDAGTVAPII
jgi:hypothetical protein